jgi:hypothetical protein
MHVFPRGELGELGDFKTRFDLDTVPGSCSDASRNSSALVALFTLCEADASAAKSFEKFSRNFY